MKAIINTRYGTPDDLQLREVPKPTPKDNEILIKVHAATVTAGDCEVRRFQIPAYLWLPIRLYMGILKPRVKILGIEMAGEVVAAGKKVRKYKTGDQVFGSTGMRLGAHAEYLCLPESHPLALKSPEVSYEQVATIPTGGINALHFIRKADLQRGETLLINGAGGSIGTYAIQLAKSYGAEVTAVDSGPKLDMLRAIGARHVIDYTLEDFTQNGQSYDVIFDVVGKSSFSRSLKALNPRGRYILGNPTFTDMMRGLWTNWTSDKKVIFEFAAETTEDLAHLQQLIRNGRLQPVIDKRLSLEEVPKGHRYVERGEKKGNLVITVAPAAS